MAAPSPCLARPGSPAPLRTAQAWGRRSIWHWVFPADPSGLPSSKNARRYQPPSQALASILSLRPRASEWHLSA